MIGQSAGLAMTDLFISAAAALLMVLAVSQPFEPQPIPLQADFLATCPAQTDNEVITNALVWPADRIAADAMPVAQASDLANLPDRMDMSAKPYYLLAVVPDERGVITGRCYTFISKELVATRNSNLDDIPRADSGSRSVYVVSLANMELPDGK